MKRRGRREKLGARNQKTMGNVPKSEQTGVPVTAEASKAEERAARRVDDRELVRAQHVLVSMEQMP